MKYISTNKQSKPASFEEAIFQGLASDGGLFLPENIPVLPKKFFKSIQTKSINDIALAVLWAFFKGDMPKTKLKKIIDQSFTFEIPLIKLDTNLYVLELFHGPTMAFKDIGARFMTNILSFYLKGDKKISIVTATSGDTGAAVASAFHNVANIEVFLLYPKHGVSKDQEELLAKWGNNINAFAIDGTFDDCQKIVKQAMQDKKIKIKRNITSANSINIARLLPQITYYFYAFAQLKNKKMPIVVSVPSGNFGNLAAGLIAKKMGLPIYKFVAATNANNTFSKFLETGIFSPKPSRKTISNAMDVGNPSNFFRIILLYNNTTKALQKDVWSKSFSDNQTKDALRHVYKKYNYVLDPHGAVSFLGLHHYQKHQRKDIQGIFFETAHPAKFKQSIEKMLNITISKQKILLAFKKKKNQAITLTNEYSVFKRYLI